MTFSYIFSAVRTPIGSFGGSLQNFSAPELGSFAIREALKQSGFTGEQVCEAIMGNVLQAGLGQAPARQAARKAGLPDSVAALTVNKVCSSGLVSLMLADLKIKAGEAEVVVAGGMESMSNAPYVLPKARFGYRLGDGKLVDVMVNDGLWDAYGNTHMGNLAENCAKKYSFSRQAQDEFAIESYKRAQHALAQAYFANETLKVEIASKKGSTFVTSDEEPAKVSFEKISSLNPVFEKDGTITAANASSLSDGAAALVLGNEAAVKSGAKPLAKIIAYTTHSQAPEWYTTAPVGAVQKLLEKTGIKIQDIDLFEINEAFSCVTMAAISDLKLDTAKVNVTGGAVALGHPIGSTGARLVVTLLHNLKRLGKKRGIAALCNGGGEATAMLVELV